MLKRWAVLLLVVSLSAALVSCEKLPTQAPNQPFEPVKFKDSIPLEYGTLVGVTPHPRTENWAVLWFEKPDKSIAAVWVNIVQGQIGKVATISRK